MFLLLFGSLVMGCGLSTTPLAVIKLGGSLMKKMIFILLFYVSIIVLPQNNNIDYYPIKIGYEWKYKAPGKDWEEKFIVSTFDNTYDAYLIKQIIKLGDLFPITNEKLFEKRNGKVLLLGTRGGAFNTDWKFSSEVVLENNLEIGRSWENKIEDGIEEFKILEFSDISVAAGQFKNVLVLQKITSATNSKSKKKEEIQKLKLYYAPNVGLIKTEVFIKGKNIYEIFTELIDYKLF